VKKIQAGPSALFAISLIFSGCASTSFTRMNSKVYPSKGEHCAILVMADPPTHQRYEEVCLINARGSQSSAEGTEVNSLIPEMKEKGCECGADAIVLRNSTAVGDDFGGPKGRAQATATAIKFLQK
jgi:hypothetical protein